jgi:hypothetical protein
MSTHESIARDLDRLADLKREIEERHSFFTKKRERLLKKLQPQLTRIANDEAGDLRDVTKAHDELVQSIKAATIAAGETQKGQDLQCVFYGPRASWNDDMLRGMAANLPQIMTARSETEPSAQIRPNGKSQEKQDKKA